MPSLVISDSHDTMPVDVKTKKEKKIKKIKSQVDGTDVESPETDKKSKKSKKTKSTEIDGVSDVESAKKSKKKEKKRKAAELDDSDKSDTSAELGEPVNSVPTKKAKGLPADSDKEEEEANPNAVSNFRISKPLRDALDSRGIKALFPIQAMTFNLVLDGCDLVGRARTGQGKTLAFVLPILESLVNGRTLTLRKTGYGKAPSVLVLLPTRELAKQVHEDFQVYGGALGLTSCCVYGGAPFRDQTVQLKRGVDVVVGSPGRIKDHLERGNINLGSLQFRVLDEADEMLRMGFVEDVEMILSKVDDVTKVQTLLFSATLPDWVRQIASRFLKADKKTVDLVSDQKMKASTSVRHIVIPCSVSARPQLIPDVIQCYSSGGRTIIFTETKDAASQLAGTLPGARALHGDIQQATREVTLSGFRSGKFSTLVATNVAARGLDINDVELIIQCEPPRDVEAYIHRSGRTGRAGNTGVAVMLYDPRKGSVNRIERESGVKFEHLTAPQPADVAKAAGVEAMESISQVSDSVIPVFKSAAEELLKNSGLSAVEILSKALAKAAGYSDIKKRSLLSSMENYVTLHLECGRPIFTPTMSFNCLRRYLPDNKVEAVKEMTLTADGNGAVFDVPADDVKTYLAGDSTEGLSVKLVKELPKLQVRDAMSRGRFGNSSGGRFGRGGGGGGFRRNDRFSSGGGGGFRGGRGGGGRGGRR